MVCNNSYFLTNIDDYINSINNNTEKRFIKYRFSSIIKNLEKKTKRSNLLYYGLSGTVTIGTILIPPILSIQNNTKNNEKHLFWGLWFISLSVTLANAFIKLLSIDKIYITRNLMLNQLKSEGIKYINMIGEYEISDNNIRFSLFVNNIEMMKRKQILEEYIPMENKKNINRNFIDDINEKDNINEITDI